MTQTFDNIKTMIENFGNRLAEDLFYDTTSKEARGFSPELKRAEQRKPFPLANQVSATLMMGIGAISDDDDDDCKADVFGRANIGYSFTGPKIRSIE